MEPKASLYVGGGTGGREMLRKREERGREAGEKGKNYAILHNILQSKK